MDQRQYKHLVRDRIYHQADAVVAAGGFAQKQLLRIGIPESRICKITPGVDCERFSPRSPREDLVRRFSLQYKKVLLTVARLYPRKGHDIALQAIAPITAELAALRYLIVVEAPVAARFCFLAAEVRSADTVPVVGPVASAGPIQLEKPGHATASVEPRGGASDASESMGEST